jgi:signal transduction histidine kinase
VERQTRPVDVKDLDTLVRVLRDGVAEIRARTTHAMTGARMAVITLAFLVGLAVFQVVLVSRDGVPLVLQVTGTLAALALAVLAIWMGVRLARFASARRSLEMAVSLADQHARALEAVHAEVVAQRDRLLSAQNEAETLAQVIVHDLKNPLATLLQYVSLAEADLRAMPGASGPLDYLQNASEEGRRLSKLIGDLLLVYRLEQGVMRPSREMVPARLLLESVARRFGPRATRHGVRLEVDAEDDLLVPIDLELVQRMLDNLIANALRHVNRGNRVGLFAGTGGGEIRLAVRNSGPPVPEHLKGGLFGRFVVGERREWRNVGLGLYLCRLVAEAHSGSIALVDRPGWNVSFEAVLPLPTDEAVPTPLGHPTVRVNEAP